MSKGVHVGFVWFINTVVMISIIDTIIGYRIIYIANINRIVHT